MKTIEEGSLAFDFPDTWHATKYDDWVYYRTHFQSSFGGTKAVDILALRANHHFYLIEIKDYRIEPRQKDMELAQEVAEKVRDTLAALFAARIVANKDSEKSFAERSVKATKIVVILHLEQPTKPTRLHPIEDTTKLEQKLRQLLRAIDPHPRVTKLTDGNKFGWEVREI